MTERMFVQGNDAVGWGAVSAGCKAFFGYPITPQNEIPEWFSREMPKRGGVFVQSQCETGAICMVYGSAATGTRAMTSTSGPGWSLMQEMVSGISAAEVPCVIVVVQRGGPGGGPIRHAQMDYTTVTCGGGHGDYRTIVLGPASVQEICDHVQLAFYLADKYRNPVVVLSDGVLGLLSEPIEVQTIDFSPLPEKDWAVRGRGRQKDGKFHYVFHSSLGPYTPYLKRIDDKFRQMEENEVRYETDNLDDAELILVAYGYTARVAMEAMNMARAEGYKVGLIRPITLWPFPYKVINENAIRGCKYLVVEDSLGQLVKDVEIGVQGHSEVHLVNILARHLPTDAGMIMPEAVVKEVKKIL